MKGGKPALACAGLALAAHAALLLAPGHPAGPHSAAATAAVTARLAVDAQPAAEPEATLTAAEPREAAPAANEATPATKTEPPRPDALPPAFAEDALPSLGFPDAPLPPEGVQLRAYLELETDGSPRQVSTAAPTDVPLGFQKVAEVALRQARLKPGLGAAYCLLVRFEPDTPAPTLAWLPGVARDASRCLSGTQPAPRELESPAAP